MKIKLTAKDKIKIKYPTDIYAVMKRILLRENKIDRNKEHFWVIGLNVHSTILFIELISIGGTSTTIAEPMQVFRVAVLKGATSVILIHNHPSGELEPSKADKDTTDRLLQSGKILDIKVIDHLIISEKEHYSFNKSGLLAEIEKNSSFLLGYELEEQIREQAIELGKLKGQIEEKKQMAKLMKAKGYKTEAIQELTGLKESEITEL